MSDNEVPSPLSAITSATGGGNPKIASTAMPFVSYTVRPCFVCGVELVTVSPDLPRFQADGGALCQLLGNYGSTVHDNLIQPRRAFWVCDACLGSRYDRTEPVEGNSVSERDLWRAGFRLRERDRDGVAVAEIVCRWDADCLPGTTPGDPTSRHEPHCRGGA